jgi:hypothetical protein
MRPYSSGGPRYLSKSGRTAEAFTVAVGKAIGADPRTVPIASGAGAPSSVNQYAADAVEGANPINIAPHDLDAGRPAGRDRPMELFDGRFFKAKRFGFVAES